MHFNNYNNGRYPFRNQYQSRPPYERSFSSPLNNPEPEELPDPTSTGSETNYFRNLIDSKMPVTVVLLTGERLHGLIRYYDHECFSIGLQDGGPNLFLRKESVRCIYEE
jgi:sRNA-binding regulator protein Hfq